MATDHEFAREDDCVVCGHWPEADTVSAAILPDRRLLNRLHLTFEARKLGSGVAITTNHESSWPENDNSHSRCDGAGLFAYQYGGQPNELYNGSFGAKTHIASAPTISPATNPSIMSPSKRKIPRANASGEMGPSRADPWRPRYGDPWKLSEEIEVSGKWHST